MTTLAIAARDGIVLCGRCTVADTAPRRVRGLLGRARLPAGEGLLLRPAPAVHTWFMRFAIDVVFLDRDLVVLKVRHEMRPWRMARCKRAHAVLELPAGQAGLLEIAPGDRLEARHHSP